MNPTVGPRSAQPARSLAEPTDFVSAELRRYDDHLRDVRGLAAGTHRNHFRIVGLLLRRKFAGGVVAMASPTLVDVGRHPDVLAHRQHREQPLPKWQRPCEVTSATEPFAVTRLPD